MAKADQVNVDSVTTDKQGNIEVTIKTAQPEKQGKLVKRVGEFIDGDVKTAVLFRSTRRELMLLRSESSYVQFRNHCFLTNVPEVIEYIRTHPAFGQEIFEKEYPEQVKKKIEEYRSKITRDPQEHDSGE